MRTSATLAVVGLLTVTAGPARADSASPFYPERKVGLKIRFVNLQDHPDWVFYLEYLLDENGRNRPDAWVDKDGHRWRAVRLESAEPFSFPDSGRRLFSHLIAVPRRLAGPAGRPPSEKPPPKESPGVLHCFLYGNPATSFFLDLNDGYVIPYEVTIKDGKLDVLPLPAEPVRPEMDLGFTRLPVRQTVVLAALALAVGGALLTWVRRRARARRPT
jgi:hypothetical protein